MEEDGLIVWKMFVVMWVSFLSAAIFLLWGEDVPWLVSAALALCLIVCFIALGAI